MPLKPNRPGALRGPEGMTLDEIVAQMRGLNDKIDNLVTLQQVTNSNLDNLIALQQVGNTSSSVIRPVLLAIYQALGEIGAAPAGRSIKSLLAEIQTCLCEEPGTIGTDYSPAAPPAGGCGGSYSEVDYIQLAAWEVTTAPNRVTARFHTAEGFMLVEPAVITVRTQNPPIIEHTYNALRRVDSAGNVELCANWVSDVSPAANVTYQRYTNVGGGIYNSAGGGGDLNIGTATGNDEVFLDEDAIVFFVDYPGTVAEDPQFKLWLKGYGAS